MSVRLPVTACTARESVVWCMAWSFSRPWVTALPNAAGSTAPAATPAPAPAWAAAPAAPAPPRGMAAERPGSAEIGGIVMSAAQSDRLLVCRRGPLDHGEVRLVPALGHDQLGHLVREVDVGQPHVPARVGQGVVRLVGHPAHRVAE